MFYFIDGIMFFLAMAIYFSLGAGDTIYTMGCSDYATHR